MTPHTDPKSFKEVAIFWDYENCAVPEDSTTFKIAEGILHIAHQHGVVTTFRAYCELDKDSTTCPVEIRTDLRSCGVTVIDCPHNGKKDAADKVLMADMYTFAMDTARESTIILISGDSDFIYVVSMLRHRKFNVILVAPWTARRGFKNQATATYDYPSMAYDAGHSRNRSSASQIGLPTPPAGQWTFPTPPRNVVASPPSSGLASPAFTASRPALPAGASPPGGARFSSPQHTQAVPQSASAAATSTATPGSAGPSTARSFADAVARRSPLIGTAASLPQDRQGASGDVLVRDTSPLPWRSRRVEEARARNETPQPSSADAQASTTVPAPLLRGSSSSSDSSGGTAIAVQVEIVPGTPGSEHDEPPMLANFAAGTPGLPHLELAPSPRDTHYWSPESLNALSLSDEAVSVQSEDKGTIDTRMIRLKAPPKMFRTLVQTLEAQRREGITRTPLSQVGSLCRGRNPKYLRSAGFVQLKDYIREAGKKQIAILGPEIEGDNGNRWVALHPFFHGLTPEEAEKAGIPVDVIRTATKNDSKAGVLPDQDHEEHST